MPLLALLFWSSKFTHSICICGLTWQCVGIDAFMEDELVKALKITNYPEIIFTKNGKILHRDIGGIFYKLLSQTVMDSVGLHFDLTTIYVYFIVISLQSKCYIFVFTYIICRLILRVCQ